MEGFQPGRMEIEPLGKFSGREIRPIPSLCDPSVPEYKEFMANYVRTGQIYAVTFGGAPAGTVRLRGPNPDYGIDPVEYAGPVKIHRFIMALATNAKLTLAESSGRYAPSPGEHKLALQLANEKFAEHGLARELLSRIQIENLTFTRIAPSKSPVLLGSFSLPLPGDSGITHYLFFIASESGGQLAPEFVWTKIATTETENEALHFVDQADLFGDGQQEVVAVNTYYENFRYRVYRRTKDGAHWEQILETEVLGCV
jgi:hypothetical protein